ncbi:hypothetical protein [Streptomyces sp. NPDC018045]|uniref:hypothetical protein n=1 Tax=Streptomyces sp. NPDC018045 TaxID=3365037 RepID=UPI00379E7014
MSLTKRYMEDLSTLTWRAHEAAGWERGVDRMTALSEVFSACGEAATAYQDPERVTVAFVREVTNSYLDSRTRIRELVAA